MTDQHESPPRVGPTDAAEAWRWLGTAIRPLLGWALAAAGIATIVAGYLGVSREALVARQLPYLISGGIGGIALVFLGAALLGVDDLRRTTRRLDDIERQVGDLHRLLLEAADDEPAGADPPTAENGARVVALPEGQSYHRAECAAVRHKAVVALTPAQAVSRGLAACRLCEPPAADGAPVDATTIGR